MFWDYTDILVPFGQGGGFSGKSSGNADLRNNVFDRNQANSGSALAAVNFASLMITNTTFVGDGDGSLMKMNGVTVETCATRPCGAGFGCHFDEPTQTRSCYACHAGTQGNGEICEACPEGTESAEDYSDCTQCSAGKYSDFGYECQPCPVGFAGSDGFCTRCPVGRTPDPGSVDCGLCPDGTARPDAQLLCEPCSPGSKPNDAKSACELCPVGTFSSAGSSCQVCGEGSAPNAEGGADSCILCAGDEISVAGEACTKCPTRQAPNSMKTGCDGVAQTYKQVQYGSITC